MAESETLSQAPTFTDFETHPTRYRHWSLQVDGEVARLSLSVQQEEGLSDSYLLKQNSYDLGVDIELADAIQRIRFEHPAVRVLVLTSAVARIFCAGANIYMLGKSTHAFKVNFCKFTNETRLGLEDLSVQSGVRTIAALNGTAAGGGYELALACDEIYLVEDGNSAVSFPEVPLLAVLPGTGGLTRLVDKRKVRRDRADIFCTIAEGIKGKRAKDWNLVDDIWSKSSFPAKVEARIAAVLGASEKNPSTGGVALTPLSPKLSESAIEYRFVTLRLDHDHRSAELVVQAPPPSEPVDVAGMRALGASLWALQAFRELDDALLHLRLDYPGINVVALRTTGDAAAVLRVDQALLKHAGDRFVKEVTAHMARVLRRLDLTAKSLFALVEPGSAFAGSLYELALASDRIYMLADQKGASRITLSGMNGGALPSSNGQTRLSVRFHGEPKRPAELLQATRPDGFAAEAAEEAGLVTMALDDLDYEDETRIAIEERASLSPDALTGMEASLRFPGAESMATKIFGRLSAWQNWIFQRPNAVGPTGALTNYGQPTRPVFDYRRT